MIRRFRLFGAVVICLGMSTPYSTGLAATESTLAQRPTVAVLDFELNDLTLNPGTRAERERTASIAPLLRDQLARDHSFSVVDIDKMDHDAADEAFGYLFDHYDVAAELGNSAGSDWIIVGRVHKASFLFVYLRANLIDTTTKRLVRQITVEVKGPQKRLTAKGVESVAEQISEAIGTAIQSR